MIAAAFLVICLAAGFYAGSKWKVSRVYVAKDSGHPLYFLSALIAVFLFVWAVALDRLSLSVPICVDMHRAAKLTLTPFVTRSGLDLATNLAIVTGWVLISAFLLPRLLNFPFRKNAALLDQIAENYGEREAIDELISDAARMQLPVLVTLDDAKVYVGYAISGEPFGSSSKRWLRVRPMFSGYRDSNCELCLTTDYQAVIDSLRGANDFHEVTSRAFDVVVPFDRVVSIHPFDLLMYRNFFKTQRWDPAEQEKRLSTLSSMARESEPMASCKIEYWVAVGLLALTPVFYLAGWPWVAGLSALISIALGVQSCNLLAGNSGSDD